LKVEQVKRLKDFEREGLGVQHLHLC
jgi:hypothetical protein